MMVMEPFAGLYWNRVIRSSFLRLEEHDQQAAVSDIQLSRTKATTSRLKLHQHWCVALVVVLALLT